MNRISSPILFPPEPPVAWISTPERRTAGKGAPVLGAAERTLAGEHRSGIAADLDGRRSGNRIEIAFPLVSLEHSRAADGCADSLSPKHFKLIQRLLPMLNRFPFGGHIPERQVQQFERRFFAWKRAPRLNDFSQRHV
jgi:hypothetical protein